jgi:hypothetical protein
MTIAGFGGFLDAHDESTMIWVTTFVVSGQS